MIVFFMQILGRFFFLNEKHRKGSCIFFNTPLINVFPLGNKIDYILSV